jgi:flagellar basal-body rod protein FlgB
MRRIVVNLFGGTIHTLEKSLDYSTAKNRTIANNIANVDTPNYKANHVTFKNTLANTMSDSMQTKRTHPKHFTFDNHGNQSYVIRENNSTTYNHNGNNVDIDQEMAELAKNQIYYQAIVDRLNGKFRNMGTVIRGGS